MVPPIPPTTRRSRVEIAREGADMIGAWWDECKHIRELYPKGDRRKAAFEVGARRLEIRLADIGLPMPRNLPSGKAKAVPEAYRRFLAVAGTEVL